MVDRDDHNNTVIRSTRFDDKHDDHKHDCDFKATLPDTDEWMEVLLQHRAHGTKFTDPQFPPEAASLSPEDDAEGIIGKVASWRRLSELFNTEVFYEFSFSEHADASEISCYGYKSLHSIGTDILAEPPEVSGLDASIAALAVGAAEALVTTAFAGCPPGGTGKGGDGGAGLRKIGGAMADSYVHRQRPPFIFCPPPAFTAHRPPPTTVWVRQAHRE